MAFKLSGDAKKIVDRGAQQNSAAPVSKPAPVQKSQASVTGGNPNTQAVAKPSTGGFKLNNESKALVDNANRFTVQGPKTFQFAGNYYSEDGAGNYIKNSYIKKQSDRDKKKVEETGHETLGTDIGQATKAGLKGWVAPQLSTLATVPLAITAAVHGDNHYEPQAGGGLWKMLNAAHAENQEAARLREASTEGRGTVGSTLLEGYSSAVTNGIDTALSLIPYVGPTLTKVSFASRAFGGSAQAARDEGKSIGTQVLTGAVSAAIEAATENLWTYGGVRDITGGAIQNTGPLGNLTNKLESSLAKKAGPIVSRLAMTFGTEAVEEMMADVLNPIASFAVRSTLGKTKMFEDYEGEEWQGVGNMLHDGFVGGIAGILGGVSSAVEAVDTYRQSGNNNALYATALRQQFETQRDEARANSGFANAIRKASFVDALDTLMSRKTGKTVSEKVSEARGTYVNRRDAFKMIGDMDADYQQVCQQVAKKFADDNFSNELISKDTLEKAVYKYLVNGEFAEELNTMDDVKNQIATLTKDIMTEYATELQNKANSKKNKARAAFYSSLLSQMVNQNVTEQTETEAAPEVTEYQTYGYTADELAEDQARVQAEAEAAAQAEAEAARPQFSKKDQNRIDSIFNDPNKAVRLGQSEKDNAIRDAIYARAEAEGKEVVETTRGNKTEYKIVNRVAEAPVETQQNIDNATVSEYNNPTETIENTGVEANGTEEGTAVPGLGGETGEGLSTGRENDTGLSVEGQNGEANSVLAGERDVAAEEATRTLERKRGIVGVGLKRSTDSASFSAALQAAKDADPAHGNFVSFKSAEDVQAVLDSGGSILIAEDGSAGLLVTADGDIEAAFRNQKTGKRGSLPEMLISAIAHGGVKLDCYGIDLANSYAKAGFIPVARVIFSPEIAMEYDGWTQEQIDEYQQRENHAPDVIVMMHNGDSANAVAQQFGDYTTGYSWADLDALPTFDGENGYDDAIALRNRMLENGETVAEETTEQETAEAPAVEEVTEEAAPAAETQEEQTPGEEAAPEVEAEEAQAEAQAEEAEAAEETAEAETEAEEPEVETETEETTEEEAEQPKAARRKPISEAHAVAEKTFGKEGRVKATRVVEAFKRIKTPFKKNKAGTWGEHAKVVNGKFDKMLNVLMDVNDGYGTVKNVYNNYKTWRDNRLMSAYYDADISNGFYRLVAEANEKGWEFNEQEQADFAQAYEDLCNAMIAKVNNVNRDTERLYKLRGEAIANKLNIKSDGLISKAIQKWIRMQATTDTAMKFFGGFKGSGEFYDLAKDIKNSVARRMVEYVDAYSYFDSVKQMKGFNDFISGKKYKLDPQSDSLEANPFEGQDFTMQQIVAMKRLLLTMEDTVLKDSDATVAERVKGLVIKDAKGNSTKIDLSDLLGTDSADSINAIIESCNNILNQDTDAAKCARAYDEACSKMFNKIGTKVSDTKKAITGLGLTLIGENYTPLLWEKEDGTSDYNFSRSDRIKSPSFTYERTDAEGYLVVQDISKIVDKYIEKAADYIGTAQIKDTLARVNEGNNLVNNGRGLNSVLAENFGREAGSWFDEYVKDLTQYQENDSIWAALRRNMQKGALIGSPSVMMKQVSSYWSAMGLLSPEALTAAYRWKVGVGAEDFSAVNSKLKYRHISDKFDPTLSEMIQDMSKYGSVSNSRVFKLFTNGISEQDYKTVDNLFAATMLDTYMKNQDRGAEYFASGEFQEDVDSKFTEVMMRSQPMFDTELRAEYARTDNELVKMTSMFRTQQTQNLNLIATAIGEYNAAKGTDAQSEKAQVLRQTVAGQIAAAVSLSLLTLAADAMLHGLKKYRGDGDDDDEKPGDGKIELQRILGRVGLNAVETGAGTMWLGDYVAKWLIDRMSGGETSEYYGVNFGPLTTLKNLMETVEYAVKKPTRSNIKNCATNISQLMGIPLNNAYRILNSAAMYYCDITGENPNNYDDILKMWDANVTVAEKNNAGKNLLIESGLSKKEATNFIKEIDTDNDGLSKDELEEYYIDHPDEAEKVSILWDSMGWKQTFAKAKKGLDKKVTYASNPLYAEMDEDESGSVTKSEMMQYALDHEDQLDELSELYREQGYKGTFRSALKSAENEQLKEQAEDAFYEGDYNVLFDTVSQMKNGKSYLTNLVKDEYDEYDNVSNPLIRFMIDAKRPTKEIDEAVEAYGTKKLIPQYKALRATGLSPSAAIKKLDGFDANANGSITQAELAEYYKAHKDEEAMIAEFWEASGWATSWSKYKKRKKLK